MVAFYNENDPEKVAALKALMAEGFIAPGEIDDRDIRDVAPIELAGFAQCHFFAGVGLWSVAARAAGIPDDFPLWSGSCPCQPFSAAGAGDGVADPRHLWPHWFWLIAQQRPRCVVGEQVASKDGLAWIELVSTDMERAAYAGGGLDLCSAGLGAPNIRQRLYMCWLAERVGEGCERGAGLRSGGSGGDGRIEPADDSGFGGLANADGRERRPNEQASGQKNKAERRQTTIHNRGSNATGRLGNAGCDGDRQHRGKLSRDESEHEIGAAPDGDASEHSSAASGMGDTNGPRAGDGGLQSGGELGGIGGDPRGGAEHDSGRGQALSDPLPAPTNGFWADADWLLCRDPDGPKLRAVRPGSFCLAAGHPGRAGELRAYGDAINLQVATAFLEAIKPELMA